MKPGLRPAIALLAILGIVDLLQVPFMVAAQQYAGEPPTVAIIVIASLARLAAGRRPQRSAAQARP